MGAIRPIPGMVNVVPGRVICSVDLRNPSDALMKKAERDFTALCRKVAILYR